MIQTTKPPRLISGHTRIVSHPNKGMCTTMLSAIHKQVQATAAKDALEGMEADEAAPVVGFHHQKHDRGNNGDVGQRAGHVVGKSASTRGPAGAGRLPLPRLHVHMLDSIWLRLVFDRHTLCKMP